jgi:hypothetical protein
MLIRALRTRCSETIVLRPGEDEDPVPSMSGTHIASSHASPHAVVARLSQTTEDEVKPAVLPSQRRDILDHHEARAKSRYGIRNVMP